jgi:hypothetical protein
MDIVNLPLHIFFSDTFQEVKSKRDKKKEVSSHLFSNFNVPYHPAICNSFDNYWLAFSCIIFELGTSHFLALDSFIR